MDGFCTSTIIQLLMFLLDGATQVLFQLNKILVLLSLLIKLVSGEETPPRVEALKSKIMEHYTIKLLEEEEGECAHSGAEVVDFQSTLSRDMGAMIPILNRLIYMMFSQNIMSATRTRMECLYE